ncbi:MAG: helix-turn-helix transcriptional regulator, partial [Dehalococcoidia bacterium]
GRFGEVIKTEREKRGWSQANLAEKMGLSIPMISHYENNKVDASLNQIRKMARLFNTDINELLRLLGWELHGDDLKVYTPQNNSQHVCVCPSCGTVLLYCPKCGDPLTTV